MAQETKGSQGSKTGSREAKFGEEAWRASVDALSLQLKAMHELRRSADPVYRTGPSSDGDVEGLAKKSQDFLFGLARLQLDHFQHVLEFGNRHFDALADQLQRLGRLGAALTGETPRAEVSLRGAPGGTVSATFVIHNLRTRPASMRFLTTEFTTLLTPEDERRRFAAPVVVEPVGTSYGSVLEAYADANFRVRVTLERRAFRPGRYRATTYVMDGDAVAGIVDLALEVLGAGGRRARGSKGASRGTRRRRGA
jgi:hypothetical protein